MRRFAYAVAFLVLMGMGAAGLFSRSQQVDGRSLLISAAEAMEQAQTIHVVGRATSLSPDGHPWGRLSEGRYETWYTPRGIRNDNRGPDGDVLCSVGSDIESGRAWTYGWSDPWFGAHGVFKVFQVEGQYLASEAARERTRFVEGRGRFDRSLEMGATVTTGSGSWNGQPVTVLQLHQTASNGQSFAAADAYLDAQGRLVGYQLYAPEEYGGEVIEQIELVEYDVEPPADLFTIQPHAGVPVTFDFAEPYPNSEDIYVDYFASGFGPRYLIAPSGDWRARASSTALGTSPSLAIDGDIGTRWTARARRHAQEPGMWFEVRFEQPVRANKALIHSSWDGYADLAEPETVWSRETAESADEEVLGGAGGMSGPAVMAETREGTGWCAGVQVSITTDGTTWEDVLTGQATADLPVYANFGGVRDILGLRLALTETSEEEAWSIAEIRLFGPPDETG